MRKQDYETLARELRRCLDTSRDFPSRVHLETTVRRLAELLHVDRAAFLTACGLKP